MNGIAHGHIAGQPGVMSSEQIKALLTAGYILPVPAATPIPPENIQPSSVDLRLGSIGYRVPASFLLSGGGTVQEKLEEYENDYYKFKIDKSAFLEARKTYVFELQERLNLPEDLRARSNPKSSTGRIDTFARLITDNCTNFDNVAPGYKGKLYLIVYPMSFDIKVKAGLSLNQIRFSTIGNHHRLTTEELKKTYREENLLYDKSGQPIPLQQALIEEDGLFLTVDLSDDTIGYRSKKNAKPIDLAKHTHKIEEYWEPIKRPTNGRLILDPDYFYILKSKEKIRIPMNYACEMVDFHSGIGEFRSHYAGFFDPGFGYGKEGEIKGSHAVLELRMRDSPMELVDGQIVVKMVFERMSMPPAIAYGVDMKSNYQNQSLRLSKHFVHE